MYACHYNSFSSFKLNAQQAQNSFYADGKFPLDNRPNPCYDRQRGLDIPDVSPEGNPLPRHPEFEPLAGRPYLLPEKEDISFAGVAEWQTRQT